MNVLGGGDGDVSSRVFPGVAILTEVPFILGGAALACIFKEPLHLDPLTPNAVRHVPGLVPLMDESSEGDAKNAEVAAATTMVDTYCKSNKVIKNYALEL